MSFVLDVSILPFSSRLSRGTRQPETSPAYSIHVSPCVCSILASASDGGTIILHQLPDDRPLRTW